MIRALLILLLMAKAAVADGLSVPVLKANPSDAEIAGSTVLVAPAKLEPGACYTGPILFVTPQGKTITMLMGDLPLGCTAKAGQFTKVISPTKP